MKLLVNGSNIDIEIDELEALIHGWVSTKDEIAGHSVYLFENTDNYSFEHIKDFKIADIPDNVLFIINDDERTEPTKKDESAKIAEELFNQIPKPFNTICFSKINNITSIRIYFCGDNEYWGQISNWTINNYFKAIKQALIDYPVAELIQLSEEREYYDHLFIKFLDNGSDTIIDSIEKIIGDLSNIVLRTEEILLGLKKFRERLNFWELNKEDPHSENKEEVWHKEFKDYPWILENCFSIPVFLLKDKAYVGGKSVEDDGGNVVDFLYKNGLAGTVCLIEIKTPNTPLLGGKYRGTYSLSPKLSGSINQLLDYKDSVQKDFATLSRTSKASFGVYNPKSILIIGNASNLTDEERKTFELYRNELRNIEIITFDELYHKLETLLTIQGFTLKNYNLDNS
ncbi:Shedu immune nuclease family protein [Priestia aryabhattai]|uniref:Shedu immune nuclease family protein n=1 Tax=Priestia aryabhattai TaxID=412384 RepID=UPI0015F76F0D|nr:Shedu immune nuclease family protein [Priestia aryabhattai]